MVVDLHTSQIQGFFDGPVDHLFALPLLTNYVGSKVDRSKLTIVSPDSGRVRVAERWSDLLGGCPIAFIHKMRDPRIPNESSTGKVVGDVKGQTCVVIDDMIDTAGTITKAVDALYAEGAKDVIIAASSRTSQGIKCQRSCRNRYLADPRRFPLRWLNNLANRATSCPRYPRGLRRWFSYQPLRWPLLKISLFERD
jgi:ribose-phosphate pyrophosphokinase